MENVNDLVQVNPEQQTDNAVKAVESYVLADVDPNFTYKNPSIADSLKFNTQDINVTLKLAKVAASSEPMTDLLVKNQKERTLWDKSVRVMDAFGSGASGRADLEIKTSELWYKKMLNDGPMPMTGLAVDPFTEEDKYNLAESSTKLQSLPAYDENYAEIIASAAGSSISTLAKNVGDVAPVVGGATALAAGAGFAVGGPVLATAAGSYVLSATAAPAIAYKSYQQASGQMYGQLVTDNPNGDKQKFKSISQGVGVVNGLLETVFTKGVVQRVPWAKSLMIGFDKAKELSQVTGANNVLLKLGEAAVAHGANGMTEMAQELSQIIGEEYGKNGTVTLDNILNNAERLTVAGAAGAITSAGIAGTLDAAGKTANITFSEARKLGEQGQVGKGDTKPKFKVNVKEADRTKAIKFQLQQDALKQAHEAVKSSEIQSKSPEAYGQILQDLHGDDELFIRNDKFKDIIKDDQVKAVMIRDKMGINISDESELTSITKDKYFKLLQLDDRFFNAVQHDADGPIQSEVDKFFNSVSQNQDKAKELESKINEVNDPKEYGDIVNQLADLEEIKLDEFATVEDYVNQPVIPDAVKKIYETEKGLPQSLIKLEEDVRAARKAVADIQVKAEKKNIDKLVRLDVAVQKDMEVKSLQEELKGYKVYDAIEAFTNPNYGKTGFDSGSVNYKINPNTLPEHLKKYVQDPTLKKYKVFDTAGSEANESAQLLGYDTPEQMFKELMIAEPRQKVINEHIESRMSEIRALSEDEIGFKPKDIRNALANQSRLHLKELDRMMDAHKASVKKGIKIVTAPMKTNDDLKIEALKITSTLKVKDLKAKMFEVNERRANTRAGQALVKGDINKAIKLKQNAALNALIRAEVLNTNRSLNYKINRLSTAISNDVVTDLRKAGPEYEDSFKAIVDVINFNRRFDTVARDKWMAWKDLQLENGEGNYDLPKEFTDSRANINDMSAQAASALVETALNIVATAKRKNELIAQRDFGNQQLLLNQVSEEVGGLLKRRKDYNPNLFDTRNTRENPSSLRTLNKAAQSFIGIHTRMEETIFRTILDKGENNGYFTNLLWKPFEDARVYKSNLDSGIDLYIKDAIKEYGTDKFFNMGYEVINDPDLIRTGYFGDTPITKLDAFTLLLNMGNDGNVEALTKTLKLDKDQVIKILERHLDESDVKLAQQHGLSYESLWTENTNTLKQMGEDVPDKVEGTDFMFKGKNVKGWYYPISYKPDFALQDQMTLKGLSQKTKEDRFKAQILTFNGHNLAREGASNDRKINLDYGVYNKSVQEIAHDIAYRIPLRDAGLTLGNESIQRDMYNILGENNYNQLQDWIESINELPKETTRGEQKIDRGVSKFISATQFATLGFNLGTMLIQVPASAPIVFNRFREDYNGTFSYPDVLQNYTRSLTNMFTSTSVKDIVGEIAKYSPDFANRLKQMDIEANKSDFGNIPDTGNKSYNNFKRLIQKTAFLGLTQMNMRLNAATWIAAHRLADAGKIKGVDPKVPQQVIEYANSVIRTELESNDILDKSAVQRMKGTTRLFTQYYSQMNVITNKFISAGYGTKIGWQDAMDLPFAERYAKRTEVAARLANRFLMTAILPAVGIGIARSVVKSREEEEKEFADYFKDGSFQVMDSFVGLRDMSFFIQTAGKKPPTLPAYQSGADIIIAANALIDFGKSPLKPDETFEFSNKEVNAMVKTLGLLGVPARPAKYLYDLVTGDDISEMDFGSNPIKAIDQMIADVGGITIDDFMKTANEDATGALDEGQTNEDIKKGLEGIKDSTEPKSVFKNPEANAVYLADVNKEIQLSSSEIKALEDYMYVVGYGESKFDENAIHDEGATGWYQFKQGTWSGLYKQYPELLRTSTVTTDLNLQNKAMWKLTGKNFYRLQDKGLSPTKSNLYALHIAGEGDGISLLKAAESEPVTNILSRKALISNPKALLGVRPSQALAMDLSKVTAGQVKKNIKNYLLSAIDGAVAYEERQKLKDIADNN